MLTVVWDAKRTGQTRRRHEGLSGRVARRFCGITTGTLHYALTAFTIIANIA